MIRKNWLLISILVVGLFLRFYQPLQFFQYSHDQDLAGWFVRDILVNHHFRLIGQETSSHGIFIGPYFYYLQIPFYLLTNFDPAGALLLPLILAAFAILSVYFVFEQMFNKKVALIGAFIYSLSTLILFTDREVVPTMSVMLWTIWFLFCLWRIIKNKQGGYLIVGVLSGLIWSINLQLIILLPLIGLVQFLSGKNIRWKELLVACSIALVLNIPFLAFEVRHGFQQTNALVASLTTNKDYVAGTASSFSMKLDRTMQLTYKNSTNLLWDSALDIPKKLTFWILVFLLGFFIWKKKIDRRLGVTLILWLGIYILFFSKVALNISEYYLNGMNIIFILIAAVGVSYLLQHKNKVLMILGYLVIVVFAGLNLYSFFNKPVDRSGYIERKAVINYIKKDSSERGYPCVSLSFITSPGRDLGYRYFTWQAKLKTKPVSNEIPVYSIVFPLSFVDGFDKSFGALGVVNPDYSRYNEEQIKRACGGEDYTTSQPMFGFTN